MKFRVHVFEEVRHCFEVEAEHIEDCVARLPDLIEANYGRWLYSESTGNFSDETLINPLNEDGAVDYENATWFTQTKSGEYVRRGSE